MVDESFIETEVDEDDVHGDEFMEEDEEYEFDEVDDFFEEDEGDEEDGGDEEHEQFEGRRRIIVDDNAYIRAFAYDKLTLDMIKLIDFKDVEHQKDYNSWYEMLVLNTHLQKLERSVALVYSHDVFYLYVSEGYQEVKL
ncbi:hypothetical protein RIF29_28725 [Crotalaria pallida]|uniref:Uncharacterized protein n=1 Tax=Crotalaria pallida TaxID=3830 RepID=A0AAN9EJW1_CROPI